MDNKKKVAIGAAAVVTAFAFGRYTAPEKVKVETKTVEVEKKVEQQQTDKNRKTHRETTVTEVKKPDGTTETTTKTVEDTKTDDKTKTAETDQTARASDTAKEVTYGRDKVAISALAGFTLSHITAPPVFGVAVSRAILGPITVGAFALTTSIVGVSIGLEF